MNTLNPAEFAYQEALKVLDILYPKSYIYSDTVSQGKQQKELGLLNETIKYERFFFVIDLIQRKIKYCNGLKRWLGYDDEEFTLIKYFQLLHPRHLASLNVLAQATFQTAHSGKYKVSFMEQKYIVQLPIRHIDGHYLLTKRTLSPFQIDNTGKVTEYLNEFTIIGKHEVSHALEPWLLDSNGNQLNDAAKEIRLRTDQIINSQKRPRPFTVQQLRILRKLAYQNELTLNQIAHSLQIKPTSMETHSRRLLDNARNYYENENFKSLIDVALYVKREGIV